ncbi:MAG: MFS transporter, partial [Myxococcota bacterium]
STLHASAQFLLPGWVRARGLSMSLTVFFGSMALGAVAWGAVASRIGLSLALTVAAVGLLVGATTALRYRLPHGEGPNLSPSKHWPAPHIADSASEGVADGDSGGGRGELGPVLTMIEYRVVDDARQAFLHAAGEMQRIRRRDGALAWQLYEDIAERGRFIETITNRTWADHLRMHDRVTTDDRNIEDSLRRHHSGDGPPRVTHLIANRKERAAGQ